MKSYLKWNTLRYIPITGIAIFLTFVTHESVHYLTGVILGNNMIMNLNEAYPVSQQYLQEWHYTLVTATAPLFTVLQAVTFFFILYRTNLPSLFPFIVSPVVMRCMALVTTFSTPNDEARLSQDAGFTRWTFPVLICSLLIYLLYLVIKKNGYNKFFVLYVILLALSFSVLLIKLNEYFLA